jgi:hypothetical protein
VSFSDYSEKVKAITIEVVTDNQYLTSEKDVSLMNETLCDSSINLGVMFWVE